MNNLNRFFVMLKCQRPDRLLPLLWESGEFAQFDRKEDAVKAGKNTLLGREFGFVVFDAHSDGDLVL